MEDSWQGQKGFDCARGADVASFRNPGNVYVT
jgi:hypothetical protein